MMGQTENQTEVEINFFEQGVLKFRPVASRGFSETAYLEPISERIGVPISGQVQGVFCFTFSAPKESEPYLTQLEVFKEVANLWVARELRRWEAAGISAGMSCPSAVSVANGSLVRSGVESAAEMRVGSFVLVGTRDPKLSMEGQVQFRTGKMASARLQVALAMASARSLDALAKKGYTNGGISP